MSERRKHISRLRYVSCLFTILDVRIHGLKRTCAKPAYCDIGIFFYTSLPVVFSLVIYVSRAGGSVRWFLAGVMRNPCRSWCAFGAWPVLRRLASPMMHWSWCGAIGCSCLLERPAHVRSANPTSLEPSVSSACLQVLCAGAELVTKSRFGRDGFFGCVGGRLG